MSSSLEISRIVLCFVDDAQNADGRLRLFITIYFDHQICIGLRFLGSWSERW